MKRCLVFTTAYKPYIGGAELALEQIIKRTPGMHFDIVTVRFSTVDIAIEEQHNVTIHRVGFADPQPLKHMQLRFPYAFNKYFFPFIGWYYGVCLHSKHSYNMVWSMMASYGGLAGLLFKLCNPHVPFLVSIQEGDSMAHILRRTLPIRPIFRKIFERADIVHAISQFLEKFSRDMGAKKTVVIPNGVDMEHWQQAEKFNTDEHARWLMQYGIERKPDMHYIMTSSRLVHKNGVDTLVEALTHLPAEYVLVVAGEGPDREKIEKIISRHKLEQRVYLLGNIPHHELPRLISAANVFVRASRSEGFGSSFIEAMAARVPVIGTPVGGIPDFLRGPDRPMPTGLFVPPEEPQAIAEAILHLEKDKVLRDRLIENAYTSVKTIYDWDVVAAEYRDNIFNILV